MSFDSESHVNVPLDAVPSMREELAPFLLGPFPKHFLLISLTKTYNLKD